MLIKEANLIFAIYCGIHIRKELDLGSSGGFRRELCGVPPPPTTSTRFLECTVVKRYPTVWEKHKFSSLVIQTTPGKHLALFRGFHLWLSFHKASGSSQQTSCAHLIKRIKLLYFALCSDHLRGLKHIRIQHGLQHLPSHRHSADSIWGDESALRT